MVKNKITHISIGNPIGGLDIIVKKILKKLKNSENKVICMDSRGKEVYGDSYDSKVFRLEYGGNNIFINLFGKIKDLKNSDLIHVHNIDLWLLFSPMLFFKKKTIYSFHGNFGSDLKKNFLIKTLISLIINYTVLFSKRLIFLTNSQKENVKKYCLFKKKLEKKSRIINNFIDKKTILKTKEKFNTDVLFVGRYESRKGFEDLKTVSRDLKEIDFYLIGDDNFQPEHPNITNLGRVDNTKISKYYDKHSILFFPSYTEAWGLVVLEAMARGNVVLASNLAPIREYFRDGRNGYLFEPGDTKKMEELILYLKNNPKQIKRISKNNLKDIHQFTAEKQIPKYIDVYNEIIKINKDKKYNA